MSVSEKNTTTSRQNGTLKLLGDAYDYNIKAKITNANIIQILYSVFNL